MEGISFTNVAEAAGVDVTGLLEAAPDSAMMWSSMFKVGELKALLKQCREYGYRTNQSQNKKGLSEDLHAIFSGATAPYVPSASAPIPATVRPNGSHSLAPMSAVPPRSGALYRPFSQLGNNDLSLSSSSSGPSNILAPTAISNTSSVHPAGPSAGFDMLPYQSLHDELLEWGCFTHVQLVKSIQQLVQAEKPVTQDFLLQALLGGGEPVLSEEERRERDKEAQLQYEKDMDRAILESEEGREHIQSCKKRRKTELKTDPSCLLGEANEFSTSYLLNRRSVTSDDKSVASRKIIQEIVSFLDSMSASCCAKAGSGGMNSAGTSSSSESVNATALQSIRSVVYDLLELEMLSYKWYKDRSTGYFIDMERKIASHACGNNNNVDCRRHLKRYAQCSLHPLGGKRNSADEEAHVLVSSLLTFLKSEVERATADLYALNTSTSVPQAFLDCDPEKKHEAKYCLDDDGFEIL